MAVVSHTYNKSDVTTQLIKGGIAPISGDMCAVPRTNEIARATMVLAVLARPANFRVRWGNSIE